MIFEGDACSFQLSESLIMRATDAQVSCDVICYRKSFASHLSPDLGAGISLAFD